MDDKSGGVIVKVSDLKTKEVILQIPSKEAIAISASLEKLQGLLVKLHAWSISRLQTYPQPTGL